MESPWLHGRQLEYAGVWNRHVCDGKNEWRQQSQPLTTCFLLLLSRVDQPDVQLGPSYLYRAGCTLGKNSSVCNKYDRVANPWIYHPAMEKNHDTGPEELS